ncbi:MAG: DUF4430 domain-containing protein [Candidatus Thermoplasmatota archaeon]|nr:DUF4430 domain-containing protein [Candidatus Thermoplasmatota archaeon]MEE3269783.1 DUF4430 domain-containing protein [Candidatus Thermoplasmatota archaeon]
MSDLVAIVVLFVIITIVGWAGRYDENRLKSLSVAWVVFLLVTFPTLSTELARMTSELVDDESDPHHGLPDIWEDKQVVCFHFPEGHAPDGYQGARHHIDSDGTEFMTDSDWNHTGACVGGFSGFENGLDLLDKAVLASGGEFAYNSTQYTFGLQINSIAGIDPCDVATCSDISGAYWRLFHNSQMAMVGISDLELDEDSVITWTIETW